MNESQDGIVNLNKPRGITSAKALYRVRKITGVRKSGHGGTLDPGADGVLLLCLGRATKLVERIMDQPKVYLADFRLDVTSATLDADSEMEPVACSARPTRAALLDCLRSFEGRIEQTPPAVSAVKIGGRPAYKLARRGETPKLRPRAVHVYWIHLRQYDWPIARIEMACGRGTYVRSLARDVGAALGVGGCVTSLTRLAIGPFDLRSAWSMDDLARAASWRDALIPLERARTLLTRDSAAPSRPRAS
ncbi:MAG: tRNA pseudouridine(55) synthase TruB [Planctomycetota bacterium]|nr:MAG: tRNA pseudouridine(55) synthase TruB [Planctomycetota bacterium]